MKEYVKHLSTIETDGVIPKQVPKSTAVAVSVAVEQTLKKLVETFVAQLDGTVFNTETITAAIRSTDDLAVFAYYLSEGVDFSSKTKKAKGSDDADEAEPVAETQFSFSCVNHIKDLVKQTGPQVTRVNSDSVSLVQFIVDKFYQRLVMGAYIAAQNSNRKTITQNDVIVSLKIMLVADLAKEVVGHIQEMVVKYKANEKSNVDADSDKENKKKPAAEKKKTTSKKKEAKDENTTSTPKIDKAKKVLKKAAA